MLNQGRAARTQKAHLVCIVTVLRLEHARPPKQVTIESERSHKVMRVVQQTLATVLDWTGGEASQR
jgi:hypothetical protein